MVEFAPRDEYCARELDLIFPHAAANYFRPKIEQPEAQSPKLEGLFFLSSFFDNEKKQRITREGEKVSS